MSAAEPLARVRPTDYRIVQTSDAAGEIINLQALTPAAACLRLEDLACRPDSPAPPGARYMQCVIVEEGPARPPNPRLQLRRLTIPPDLLVVFGDSGLAIATIEAHQVLSPAAGTAQLVATARFLSTVLAGVAWAGVCRQLLTGLCLVLDEAVIADGWAIHGVMREVRLGTPETACLAGARVIEAWEERPDGARHVIYPHDRAARR